MGKGGYAKRGNGSGNDHTHGQAAPGRTPGKVTRTSRLPSRGAAVAQEAPAPVQIARDPATEQARADQDALTAMWLDTVFRPDLYPAPVQRKNTGHQPSRPAPEPVIYFRKANEPPQRGRPTYIRRSIPGQVMDVHETIRVLLVHAYQWPAARAQGPFDEHWIAWDPPDSPGITRENLRQAAGIITLALSPALDAELERAAERMQAQGSAETADRAGSEARQPERTGVGGDTLPARVAEFFREQPGVISRDDRATREEIIALLMAMSDEDLANMHLLATHLTDAPKRFLAAIRLYNTLKTQYLATLEQALQDAAAERAPLESASPEASNAIDPATFKRWSHADKEQAARRRIEELSRKHLLDMVSNPGRTLKEIARAALRPDEALAEVSRDLSQASKVKGGWAKAARNMGATGKMTGVIAGMLAVMAVAGIFMPGVNVMFLLQASFATAMGAAALALVESEFHVRAAADAGDVSSFEQEIRRGADAKTRATVATAGMGTALAGMLVARIPLPGRLRSIGHALQTARSAVADSAGQAWQRVRAGTIDKLRQSTSGLAETLDSEAQLMRRTGAELDSMTAEQFYERVVRDDALREMVGIRKDMAESLAELARTEHGAGSARQMFDDLRQSFRDAPELARKQVEQVLGEVDRTIIELKAAGTSAELDAALARAQSTLSDTAMSSRMADTSARHTAAKLCSTGPEAASDAVEASSAPRAWTRGVGSADSGRGTRVSPSQAQDATSPDHLMPSMEAALDTKPRGRQTQISPNDDAVTRRSLQRENESAEVLAKAGYDIEQNPPAKRNGKKPDYLIEGEYFDNYAPSGNKHRNIASEIEAKVAKSQTERVVLNLEDSAVDLVALKQQLTDWPIAGLKEILVIKGGQVIPFWP